MAVPGQLQVATTMSIRRCFSFKIYSNQKKTWTLGKSKIKLGNNKGFPQILLSAGDRCGLSDCLRHLFRQLRPLA